jgi:acetylornithine deacetylase/succinyl-diaminopimelate desuccinylase-like protein
VVGAREKVLDFVDDHRAEIVEDLADLIRVPSISGSSTRWACST